MPANKRLLDRAQEDVRGSAIRVGIMLLIAPFYDWLSYLERDLPYEPVAYLLPRAYLMLLLAILLGAWSERIFQTRWPKWIRGTCFGLAIIGIMGLSTFGLWWVDSILIGHSMRGLGVLTVVGFLLGAGFMGFKRKKDAVAKEICHPAGVVG